MDPLETIGLTWVTTLICLTCVNTEFYTHLILFSREEKKAIFGEFINGSKDYFHQKLLLPANKDREAKGLDLITVDEGLCQAVRKQVLAVANNWPYNVAEQSQNIFLAYANLSSFQGLSKEYLESTRYICCDKAVRSDDITFVICGFSTVKFQPDGAPGFLNVNIKSTEASTGDTNHSNEHATPQESPARHELEATIDNNKNQTDLDSIQVLNEPQENSLSENDNNSTRKRGYGLQYNPLVSSCQANINCGSSAIVHHVGYIDLTKKGSFAMLTKKHGGVVFMFLTLSIMHVIQAKLESYVIPREKKHLANYLTKWALNNTSRDVVHNFLQSNISPKIRRLYGNITIDYNLCGAVRKEIKFRARTEPLNPKRVWMIMLFFYQKKMENKLQNGELNTVYDVGPFICCDKATRSDKTLIVMCGVMSSPTKSKDKHEDAAVGENAQWLPLHIQIDEKKPPVLSNETQRSEGSFAVEGALKLGQIITLL